MDEMDEWALLTPGSGRRRARGIRMRVNKRKQLQQQAPTVNY